MLFVPNNTLSVRLDILQYDLQLAFASRFNVHLVSD